MSEKEPRKPAISGEDEDEVIVRTVGKNATRPRKGQDDSGVPSEAPILPIRNMVIFPGTVVPLAIGREKSRRLISDVLPSERVIITVSQKDPDVDDPAPCDLYDVGTAVMILKVLSLEEGSQSIIVHGLTRIRITEWLAEKPYLHGRIEVLHDKLERTKETDALVMNARNLGRRVIELSPNLPDEAIVVLNNIDQPGALSDFLASNLQLEIGSRQKFLNELNVNERLRMVGVELHRQLEVLEISDRIQNQVKANIGKSQREYFLQEQLKAIQEELGQVDDKTAEINELKETISRARMPEVVLKEATRELNRLERLPTASPEYNVIRTYLELMCELPWQVSTEDKLDVTRARKVLNRDHYDLDKVKRRILEYLAVRKLSPQSRGPILCFVGPPGVGKTSLGQSIARAMGRKFIRMSLGGMRDEAELRGHRRTYIGAMPGRIIQEIRKSGVNNPVFMLDELDKVGADFRGDPTSALLEVLDPAQNSTFQDHYLNVPFDLSKVMFIATANYMAPVPPALQDRMEVIELPGYTRLDKLQIARKYLVPRQLKENGLNRSQAKWTSQAISKIIDDYTREAGVRNLERQIGAVCRALAAMIAEGKARCRTITPRFVTKMLGPRQFESELAARTSTPGVATGLAYTPSGGEIIFVEAAGYPGRGRLTLTGQIGDVMKESAQAAMSLLKSRFGRYGLDPERIARTDIHIHVPAGAVPKDGPSAGVAIYTALVSLLTGKAVRHDVAMTGEITLRGLVLPIGGIKEKSLAAQRAGIRKIVLPWRNRKDLLDVPADAKKAMEFVFAKKVDDVLKVALDGRI